MKNKSILGSAIFLSLVGTLTIVSLIIGNAENSIKIDKLQGDEKILDEIKIAFIPLDRAYPDKNIDLNEINKNAILLNSDGYEKIKFDVDNKYRYSLNNKGEKYKVIAETYKEDIIINEGDAKTSEKPDINESKYIDDGKVRIIIDDNHILAKQSRYNIELKKDTELYNKIHNYSENNTKVISYDVVGNKLLILLNVDNLNKISSLNDKIDSLKNYLDNIEIDKNTEQKKDKLSDKDKNKIKEIKDKIKATEKNIPNYVRNIYLIEYDIENKTYKEKSNIEVNYNVKQRNHIYELFGFDKYFVFVKSEDKKELLTINTNDGKFTRELIKNDDSKYDEIFKQVNFNMIPLEEKYNSQKGELLVASSNNDNCIHINKYILENGKLKNISNDNTKLISDTLFCKIDSENKNEKALEGSLKINSYNNYSNDYYYFESDKENDIEKKYSIYFNNFLDDSLTYIKDKYLIVFDNIDTNINKNNNKFSRGEYEATYLSCGTISIYDIESKKIVYKGKFNGGPQYTKDSYFILDKID